ncbi:transient-receptor-potential-like protein [Sitophilus oryzae]|uniref:Transient-receptor-potential-like protein n=1 Tax=Sitophilus oryzae TaxID=7048 RepID=A0A6J2XB50_SITOR|nr:transient-receptor-potential-like protein [Sitophilus oryzae]
MKEKQYEDVESKLANLSRSMPNLPKMLNLDEKKYLLAIERGDLSNVRRMLQRAIRRKTFNINCVDSLGRGALTIAIDQENLEMVELLVVMGVETKDALLYAISVEFVEAVELLLEHEELIHKEGEPYIWQKVDMNTAIFTPDITPLILAAHRNNYEILKILLDRGATIPMPHDIKCGCEECISQSEEDSLRHSLSRLNEYKALASPSLIALSSSDPLLTAFQLSWELRNLAFAEPESKSEYMALRSQCQQFAVDLLHQSRNSQELAIVLNHDPDSPPYQPGDHMKLARLELAIQYKQKKFVAHPNIQQLLAALWYEGVPGFRRKSNTKKIFNILKVVVLFPFYCLLYTIAPESKTGKLMRKPFMKFLIHAASYLFFLLLLIMVTLRVEDYFIEHKYEKQRGNPPTIIELIVLVYVFGFILEETQEIFTEGIRSYLRNLWNFIDFTRNLFYTLTFVLRAIAYIQQIKEIEIDSAKEFLRREDWDAFDPQLVAEGLFAAANIFSALKLVHMFSIDPHLGPLQISLGRMVIDIVKFFFIYTLVLFAFACGLNQLLWYFSDLERQKCYHLENDKPDFDNATDSCVKWRRFANVFESSQSLFWASFGMVELSSFELTGIKTYTRFWGLLMFGSYSVINVIVLLNLLIAMMSNSFAMIEEHSDIEWKFARTKLWMSYFEEYGTLPPPFNIFPKPKNILKFFGWRKKDKIRRMSTKSRNREEKERDYRYTAVMRALVWRYISAMHRKYEESDVTEDDVNEIKSDISSFRYELLEILNKNGMDISSAEHKEKAVLGKKMKVWERRLMKDFKVEPVSIEESEEIFSLPPEDETSLARFRRIARMAIRGPNLNKWHQVVRGACIASQIGRCHTRDSLKKQQNLQKAMEEAKKFSSYSPDYSRATTPLNLPDFTGEEIVRLIKGEASPRDQATPSHTYHEGLQFYKDIQSKPVENDVDGTTVKAVVKKDANQELLLKIDSRTFKNDRGNTPTTTGSVPESNAFGIQAMQERLVTSRSPSPLLLPTESPPRTPTPMSQRNIQRIGNTKKTKSRCGWL